MGVGGRVSAAVLIAGRRDVATVVLFFGGGRVRVVERLEEVRVPDAEHWVIAAFERCPRAGLKLGLGSRLSIPVEGLLVEWLVDVVLHRRYGFELVLREPIALHGDRRVLAPSDGRVPGQHAEVLGRTRQIRACMAPTVREVDRAPLRAAVPPTEQPSVRGQRSVVEGAGVPGVLEGQSPASRRGLRLRRIWETDLQDLGPDPGPDLPTELGRADDETNSGEGAQSRQKLGCGRPRSAQF